MKPITGGQANAIDSVCGMTVTQILDTRTESHGGSDFHFCSEKCQTNSRPTRGFTLAAGPRSQGMR